MVVENSLMHEIENVEKYVLKYNNIQLYPKNFRRNSA